MAKQVRETECCCSVLSALPRPAPSLCSKKPNLTLSLFHALTHSFTPSLFHSHCLSLTLSIPHSLTLSLTLSLSFPHSLILSLSHLVVPVPDLLQPEL